MCFNNRVSQNNSIEMASLHEFHSDESTQDSFLIAEKMCNASPPKIQLNDVTIHESRRSAYFPDETEDNDFWQQIRKMGFHPGQNLFNTSSISMPELDTKSSVSGQSSHLCKSFNDLSYDNNKTKQTSGYCSDDNKDDSYRLRDTFDHANCHFRVFGPRRGSPQFPEPSTPKRTGTSPAKQLNFPELDITIGTNLPISPIHAEKDDDFTNSYVEPSDFNNTLERIEYRLAHCPIPPMTEERRRKWKQAGNEYFEEPPFDIEFLMKLTIFSPFFACNWAAFRSISIGK